MSYSSNCNRYMIAFIPALIVLFATFGRATAAPIPYFFDVTYSGSTPETGWTAVNFATNVNTATATTNGVTVTLTSDIINPGRLRSQQIADTLLHDLVLGNGTDSASTSPSLTFNFTGLTPGKYRFTIYSGDYVGNTIGAQSNFYQDGSTASFLTVAVADSDDGRNAAKNVADLAPITGSTLTITAKTISKGSASIAQFYTVINAFELRPVPEPASIMILAAGTLVLMPGRRRRRWNRIPVLPDTV